jgi:hypothetical protein
LRSKAKEFRQTLFKSESQLNDPNHRFRSYENPFGLILENYRNHADEIRLGQTETGQYRWNASEVRKDNSYLTNTINPKFGTNDALIEYLNKPYDPKEIAVLKTNSEEIVEQLAISSGLTLTQAQKTIATKNAMKNLIYIVDENIIRDIEDENRTVIANGTELLRYKDIMANI